MVTKASEAQAPDRRDRDKIMKGAGMLAFKIKSLPPTKP